MERFRQPDRGGVHDHVPRQFLPGQDSGSGDTQAGSAGVLAEYDGGGDGTYEQKAFSAWGPFHDLWADNTAPFFQRVSSFVYYTREAAYSIMNLSIEATKMVEDLRADLLEAGSDNAVQVDCDSLPGGSPPPGSLTVAWTDANGNGQIDYDLTGAKDTFTFTAVQCWIDNPSDPEDFLMDGVMRLTYYEQQLQWGPAFDAFAMTRIRNGALVSGSTISYDGGFSLFMTTPAE